MSGKETLEGDVVAFASGAPHLRQSADTSELRRELLDNVVFQYSLEAAIADGWLASIVHQDCSAVLDEQGQGGRPKSARRRARRLSSAQLAMATHHFVAHLDVDAPHPSLMVVDDLASIDFVAQAAGPMLASRVGRAEAGRLVIGLHPGRPRVPPDDTKIVVVSPGNLPFPLLNRPNLAILSRRLPPVLQHGWSARRMPPDQPRHIFDYTQALRTDVG